MSEKTAKKVIAIENLSKSFGDHQVLRKIDFAVEKGEVICIVGSSGSGKSTLLRCINKLEQQTDGKIYFNGNEVVCLAVPGGFAGGSARQGQRHEHRA